MSYIDLQATLRDWQYESEQISVRKIVGVDGSIKVQMRIELGVLQMEATGRPDGVRPFGAESLLDYHRQRLEEYEQRNGTPLGYVLSPRQAQDFRLEASMYYRRFVSYFVLEEYDAVALDTSHNLGLFDFCRDSALEPGDRAALECYRPYVLMMDARARAYHSQKDHNYASALAHVNRGILHLRNYAETPAEFDDSNVEESGEMKILRELGREILEQMPSDSLVITRNALRTAIREEQFEEAARLRDALRELDHLDQ